MGDIDLDDLIDRLRTRLADPTRRVDIQPRDFDRQVATMSLSDLFSTGRSLAGGLQRVVAANQAGRPLDAADRAMVDQLGAAMATPQPPSLAAVATPEMLDAAERSLGHALPVGLRRTYGEVADGGFGPGSGLLGVADAVAAYHAHRIDPPMAPAGQAWPEWLLPILRYDLGVDAVDVGTGRVIGWDPETLTERSGGPGWLRTFRELAPSFEAWLDDWVRAPTPEERSRADMDRAMAEHARISRAYLAGLTPAERSAMGLPEEGWEDVVWGGLGRDDPADGSDAR